LAFFWPFKALSALINSHTAYTQSIRVPDANHSEWGPLAHTGTKLVFVWVHKLILALKPIKWVSLLPNPPADSSPLNSSRVGQSCGFVGRSFGMRLSAYTCSTCGRKPKDSWLSNYHKNNNVRSILIEFSNNATENAGVADKNSLSRDTNTWVGLLFFPL